VSTGTITFGGLSSGLDTNSIISSLVGVASQPVTQLQNEESDLKSKSTKITNVKTQLTALQTAAQALDTKQEALANSVTTSDSTVLSATASGGSAMGSYAITVSSLAQPERTYSNTFSDETTTGAAGAGTLSIQVGSGDPVDIDVTSEDTLDTIAAKINKAGAGVTAGIFHDGDSYRLQVTGTQSGTANAVAFSESDGLSLGLSDPANEKQPATDAVISVDGLTVHSSSNSISGAVPGVTLNVANTGTSTVKVDRDPSSLQTKLQTFVTAYNAVMGTLNAAFTYTSGVTQGPDTLAGDSTMMMLQSNLRSLASKVTGNGTSNLTTLSSIGVVPQKDGTLQLDADKFNKAVSSDYDGVASLLAGTTDGNGIMGAVNSSVNQYTTVGGTLDGKVASIASQTKQYDSQITAMQARISKYQDTLQDEYDQLETTMTNLKSQGSSLTAMLTSNSSS